MAEHRISNMVNQTILQILNDGEFHAESKLISVLETNPKSLTQDIEDLLAIGCEIEYDAGLGYRLPPGIKYLDKRLILNNLPESIIEGFESFDIHLTLDSTSSAAMRYVRAGHQGKALIVAEHQGQGRGRRGREWLSPMARNLYLSLVWPFQLKLHNLSGLSLVIALSLVKSLQGSGLNAMEGLRVKWPNDVWLNGKKLAGILLELQSHNDLLQQVIIGIGLNVNMPASALSEIEQPVTDLGSHNNPCVDRNLILASLMTRLDHDLDLFANHGFALFKPQWQQIDHFQNQSVELFTEQTRTSGTVRGVDESGALILETEAGQQTILGGELAPSLKALSESNEYGV